MRRGTADAGISDVLGTLLLVLAVVGAGAALSVVVASNLSSTPMPTASFALGPVAAGDAQLHLVHRGGDDLALADLTLQLSRGTDAYADVPRTSWSTPELDRLRAGDTLTVPLSPAATGGEHFRARLVHHTLNAILGDLATTAPGGASPLPSPTLLATLSPSSVVADASSQALLSVRVSHPLGALHVASVWADLAPLAVTSGAPGAHLVLGDTGTDGDMFGGDGVWSSLVTVPAATPPGTYVIPLVARDVAGFDAAHANVTLTVLGLAATEGTRLPAPTSENATSLRLTNWSWDASDPTTLAGDLGILRIVSGAHAWSVAFTFGHVAGDPAITRIETWDANSTGGHTVYLPSVGGHTSLVGLDLDLMAPAASGFTCSAQCSPASTYAGADLRGTPTFLVASLRDGAAGATGIYSMEVALR